MRSTSDHTNHDVRSWFQPINFSVFQKRPTQTLLDTVAPTADLNKHRSALRGTPGSACPQPEPNATELPSCAPISARDAQRRRRRWWWRGDEGARRPGPEAQVLRHVLWHALRNALRNCAASLACSSFTCRLGEAWGAVEHDACHDKHLCASVLRATNFYPANAARAAQSRRHEDAPIPGVVHAEVDAARRLPWLGKEVCKKRRKAHVSALVFRVLPGGHAKLAQSCPACLQYMRWSCALKGYRLKHVFFTDDGGVVRLDQNYAEMTSQRAQQRKQGKPPSSHICSGAE